MSTDVMKSIYYAYAHSILAYGIIFWAILVVVIIFLGFKKE
jgi:hypothetical protein